MRCSTLSDCRLLSRAAVSSLSPVSQFLPKRAVTTGGSVLRAIRADCAFSSVLAISNSATRACNFCELSLLLAASPSLSLSSTAATMRSTFAFSASCCESSFPSTRSSASAAFASFSAVVINCCVISSFIFSPLHFFVHSRVHLVSVVITSFVQLDPRIPICCLITAENRRASEGDVCKRPNLASDVCYASVRDFIGHPELYGWSGQGTEPGAALANFPYDLRKVFGEPIAAQFEIPAHNLCPRDHADFSPRVMAVKGRSVTQPHPQQRRQPGFRRRASEQNAVPTRTGWRFVGCRVNQCQHATKRLAVRMPCHARHLNSHRFQFNVHFVFSCPCKKESLVGGCIQQSAITFNSMRRPGRPRPGKLVQTGGSPLICLTSFTVNTPLRSRIS